MTENHFFCRPFWISYENGLLKVGQGNSVGVDTFMQYTDPDPKPVNSIQVNSGKDANGSWTFKPSNGEHAPTISGVHVHEDMNRVAVRTL